MIMKITSKTRRMSMSGTTFISTNTPPLPLPTFIPTIHLAIEDDPARRTSHNPDISAHGGPHAEPSWKTSAASTAGGGLLPRFKLRGDQANLVDSRGAHDINGASDFLKLDVVVALDEGDLFRAFFEN